MKKPVKIALWVVGGLVLLIIVALVSTDVWVSSLVQKEVHKSLEKLPGADASVGGVYINFVSGSAIVKDITFATNSLALEDTVSGKREPGLAMHIPTLSVWNINYWELIKKRHLAIYKITIDDPKLIVYMDEEHPETILPAFPEDTTLEKAKIWLKNVDLWHMELNNLSARYHSTRSIVAFSVDSLSVECRDLSYDFVDSVFAYNDSVYELNIRAFKAKLPDGISEVEVHQLKTSDQGPLCLGYTRFRNTITPKKMADIFREPTSWIDIELNSLSTSPINPIRKILAKETSLDALQVDVRRMHVCRDERYEPKKPFQMPQEVLLKIPVTFLLKKVDATVHKIDIEFSSTNVNCGEMHLKKLKAQMSNVTNRRGAVWRSHAHAPFGEKGIMDLQFDMTMNKAGSFEAKLNGHDIETHDVNSFLRPLIGMTCDCHVNQLDAAYKGDRTEAKGEFCMQYHGLNVKVYKEDDIPYKVITKNAGAISNFANTLIPKSNPTAVDPAPRRYEVAWKRDEWKPTPLYYFGPCIDGVVKTMLPGLFVHKQAKSKR